MSTEQEAAASEELAEGNAQFSFGRPLEAERHFLESIRLHPSPGAYYNLAVTYHATGRLDEAIKSYEKALAIDADYQPAARNLQLLGKTPGPNS